MIPMTEFLAVWFLGQRGFGFGGVSCDQPLKLKSIF